MNWNLQNITSVIFGTYPFFPYYSLFPHVVLIFFRYNSEGEFDEGFVHILIQAVSKHMKTVNYVSLEQVRAYLASTGIVKNVCILSTDSFFKSSSFFSSYFSRTL